MSEATTKLHNTAAALHDAAAETEVAEIRAEIAEEAIADANLEAEHARAFAADAFKAAMNTELGKAVEAIQVCLEDLKSRVASLEQNQQSSDVGDRLRVIEQLLKELEEAEEAETRTPTPSIQPPSLETVTPQSQKPPAKSENAKSEAPTRRARKTNWL